VIESDGSDPTISANVFTEAPNITGLTINVVPSSYTNKFSLKSLTKANLRKIKAKVPNGVDYDVWLPLASIYEKEYGLEKVTMVKGFFFFKFASNEGVEYMFRNGLRMICEIPIFLNKWSPSGRSSYARILIEINDYNDFSDHFVMAVPTLKEMAMRKKLFVLNTSGNLLIMVHA
nr:hypothetical protein [Tanacetum cinerariifolium]